MVCKYFLHGGCDPPALRQGPAEGLPPPLKHEHFEQLEFVERIEQVELMGLLEPVGKVLKAIKMLKKKGGVR